MSEIDVGRNAAAARRRFGDGQRAAPGIINAYIFQLGKTRSMGCAQSCNVFREMRRIILAAAKQKAGVFGQSVIVDHEFCVYADIVADQCADPSPRALWR